MQFVIYIMAFFAVFLFLSSYFLSVLPYLVLQWPYVFHEKAKSNHRSKVRSVAKYSYNFYRCLVVREVCFGSLLSASIPSRRTQREQLLWLSQLLVSRKLDIIGYISLRHLSIYNLLPAIEYNAAVHLILSN